MFGSSLLLLLNAFDFMQIILWSPYGIGQAIIFLSCGFYLSFFLSFYLSSFPCLISAVTDWMSTILPHVMWL